MNDQPEDENHVPTLLLRIEEAALRLGIGRTSMYRLIMTGDVESVHIGALHRVPAFRRDADDRGLTHRSSPPWLGHQSVIFPDDFEVIVDILWDVNEHAVPAKLCRRLSSKRPVMWVASRVRRHPSP